MAFDGDTHTADEQENSEDIRSPESPFRPDTTTTSGNGYAMPTTPEMHSDEPRSDGSDPDRQEPQPDLPHLASLRRNRRGHY